MTVLTELVAKIETDAAGLKSGLSDAEKQTEASSKKMRDSIQKVGMAMAAAGAVITAAFGFMVKSAMETQSIRIAFENLASGAGQSSDELLKSLKSASKGAISEYDLMLSANKAMVLGVATNSEQFSSLMEVARDRARAMGLTTTQAFNDIVTGIGRGSRMILDNLGIIVSLETANEDYAQSLGKTSSALTEDEKKQALLNAVLEQGQKTIDKTSQNTMTASEMFEALKASIKDLSDGIGSNLLPVFSDMVVRIKDVVSNIVGWIKEHPELAKQLTLIAGALGIFLGVAGTALILIPKLKAAWISMQLVFTASPWGAIIAGIGLLIAAGILLWQNWDKVSHFFQDIWSNMKNAVLHAIDYILKSLQNFVGWIPGLGSKIDEAREKIANMIEAEKIKRDIRDVQRELKELEETATETSETTSELATTFNPELADAVTEVEDRMESLKEEENRLGNQFADLMRKLHFAETEAGQLGLTMNDVYEAMYKLDYETGEINEVFQKYGNITEVDELLLNKLGLTADEVARIVGKLKGEVDKGTESFKKQSEEVKKLSDTVAQSARAMAGIYSPGQSFENLATAQVMAPWQGSSEHQQAMAEMESQTGAFSPIGVLVEHFKRWMARTGYVPSYQSGGYVNETGLAYLHAGEAVIPANESMGNVVVNFTQPVFLDREDTLNRFVDKISKTLDRKYRLGGRL